MREYGAMVDGIIAEELPKLLAQPLDPAIINGPQWDAQRRAKLRALFC